MQKAPWAQGRGGLFYLGAQKKPNLKKWTGVYQVSLGGGDAWKYPSGWAFQIKEAVQQKFRRETIRLSQEISNLAVSQQESGQCNEN